MDDKTTQLLREIRDLARERYSAHRVGLRATDEALNAILQRALEALGEDPTELDELLAASAQRKR